MATEQPETIRGITLTYGQLLLRGLDRITEISQNIGVETTYMEYFLTVYGFIPSLPNNVKDDLDFKDLMQKIGEDLSKIGNIKSLDLYNTSIDRDMALSSVGRKWSRTLHDTIFRLLDERGYLKIPGISPRHPNPKRISLEE